MKNRALYTLLFITFLTFPVFHTIVMAQSGSQKMHDLLTAFGESGEFNVKKDLAQILMIQKKPIIVRFTSTKYIQLI